MLAFFFKIIFMWTIFKVFMNLLQYCFCFMFWFFGCKACGVLALQPGIKPTPSAFEGEVLTIIPPRKSPLLRLFKCLSSQAKTSQEIHFTIACIVYGITSCAQNPNNPSIVNNGFTCTSPSVSQALCLWLAHYLSV